MIMPFGTYTTPKRFTGLAEVLARAESAGTMLSRSGSASVAPMPRRTVRRGMAFLAMNIRHSLVLDLPDPPAFARACCPTRAMAGKPDLPHLPRLRSRVLSDASYGGQARPTRPTTYPTYLTHATYPTPPARPTRLRSRVLSDASYGGQPRPTRPLWPIWPCSC